MIRKPLWQMALAMSGLLIVAGCGGPATDSPETAHSGEGHGEHAHEHGEHEKHPQDLKEALAQLTGMRNTIRDAFAKNDADAAHDPLHELGMFWEKFLNSRISQR